MQMQLYETVKQLLHVRMLFEIPSDLRYSQQKNEPSLWPLWISEVRRYIAIRLSASCSAQVGTEAATGQKILASLFTNPCHSLLDCKDNHKEKADIDHCVGWTSLQKVEPCIPLTYLI